MTKAFPILYSKSKTGKIKMWEIQVVQYDGKVYLRTIHGYIDGKQQVNDRQVKAGKNIGKSNETTVLVQACLQAKSQWNHKKDANYKEDVDKIDDDKILLPMTAGNYKHLKHKVKYPCFVQPKLNGVRCLSEYKFESKSLNLISRGGKIFTPLHGSTIWNELQELYGGVDIIGDGEIYRYNWRFQRILSALKKVNEDTNHLHYWLYDICVPSVIFEDRLRILNTINMVIKTKELDHIRITPTKIAHDEQDIMKFHELFAKVDIFEGIIIRNRNGLYICDYKSDDLLKLKELQDAEYEIIGGKEGEGLEEGCVIFMCKTKEGKEFNCKPVGSREERREWFQNIDSFIGKMLTVEFKEFSDDGIPVPNPVGLAVRDYE